MFEQSLMDTAIGKTRTPWAMALSCGLQLLMVGVGVLVPLLNYYELPATELMGFLVAPPPPPPPAPPPIVTRKIIPEQFNPMATPVAIPDRVAIIQDEAPPAASIAGVVGGIGGGAIGGGLGGVIGGIISSTPISGATAAAG